MMYGKTAYLAGPMSKHKDTCYNFEEFFYWAKVLKSSGYRVINPAEMDCLRALYSEWHFTEEKYEEILAADLLIIEEKADFLFVLRGWEDSAGALREIAKAEELGLPVYYEDKRKDSECIH